MPGIDLRHHKLSAGTSSRSSGGRRPKGRDIRERRSRHPPRIDKGIHADRRDVAVFVIILPDGELSGGNWFTSKVENLLNGGKLMEPHVDTPIDELVVGRGQIHELLRELIRPILFG